MDTLHARICSDQRELFRLIAEADRLERWRDWGARDLAQLLWMRFGLSDWKARRWIAAAHALDRLPLIAAAFSRGDLGVDKVVELTRFATPETEAELIPWAQRVSSGRIRHRGDLAMRRPADDAREVEEARSVWWWYHEEGRRFALEADLPAAQGAVVAKALDRVAQRVPVMPDEEGTGFTAARRADALVALCSTRIGQDSDPDRTSVIVHATIDQVSSADGSCEIEGGGIIHAETARRLACHARVQEVIEDRGGNPVGVGRMSREPQSWMVRQLRYRDRECTFPGCGSRRFAQAHHIVWWRRGGRTDLDNLVLVCTFHHKLVHEYGWSLTRDEDGALHWFRPDRTPYRAGPDPPDPRTEAQTLAAVS